MRLHFLALTVLAMAACEDVAEEETVEMDAGVRPPRDGGTAAREAADAGDAGTDARDAIADRVEASTTTTTVTVDGVMGAGEYGVHVDGQNQKTEAQSNVTWLMRSTDTTLHVAIQGANLGEAAILYIGHDTSAGATQGFSTYDGTRLDPLPFRAHFVVYFKSGYQEYRVWNGAWGAAVTSGIGYAASGNVRELAIPWTAIRAAGRPATFAFTGYLTTPAGFAYGEVPPENPSGSIGTAAVFPYFYRVTDTARPFAQRVPP
jgi:hypothetical protein